MSLALSKTLDPADYAELTDELKIVDQHFFKEREQHLSRRWEYAMALRALSTWRNGDTTSMWMYDIGGAGSPFKWMLTSLNHVVTVIDPDQPHGRTLDSWVHDSSLAHLAPAVFCLSVLEHVDDLDQFLYHLSCLVAPGGLLFLTFDCQQFEGPDTKHFHWMRKQIFSPLTILDFKDSVRRVGQHFTDFNYLGDIDLAYHGHQVYDYTFGSLALVKHD